MCRALAAIAVVPAAEELAFRGYLLRKLINPDFQKVPLGQFTWASFIISSLLFGVLHARWLAGCVAGMIFAAALYRRGMLSDAILSHGLANALLAAYVLATHQWYLWG
jgi:CAAX prenyl protease-like protein